MPKSKKRKKKAVPAPARIKPKIAIVPVQTDPVIIKLLESGTNLQNAGNFAEAENHYRKVLELQPENPFAHYLIGLIAHNIGKPDLAIDYLSRAISLFPNFADAHYNLGVVYQAIGRNNDAITSYRSAVSLDPTHENALNNLGNVYQVEARSLEAVNCFEILLAQNPNYSGAYVNVASAYVALERFDEALDSLEKVLSLNPSFAEAHNNQAIILEDLNRENEAVSAYNRAIEIKPDYMHALYSLGVLQMKLGNAEDAIAALRKAISLQPGFAMAHRVLAFIKKHDAYDDDMRVMDEIFNHPNCSDDQKMDVAFGLGKAFTELGEHEKSFEYYMAANDLRRKATTYSTAAESARFENVRQHFNEEYCANFDASGDTGKGLIFILGMPRSGTSLVEQILASHSRVYGAGEQSYIQRICGEIEKATGHSYPRSLSGLTSKDFDDLGKDYDHRLRRYSPQSPVITDKMPANFQYIGFIRKALPAAKVVHVKRDPMATCFSIFTTFFQGAIPYSYNQKELGEYYCLYKSLMDHWHAVMPGVIHDISYEALLDEPEAEIRSLLEYCDLGFEEACLNFHTNKRTVKTASANQVRKPIYRSSLERWRHNETQLSELIGALEAC